MRFGTATITAKLSFLSPLMMPLLLSVAVNSYATEPDPDIASPADTIQECLLEGEIVAEEAGDDENTVRVEFYKAERYNEKRPCLIGNRLEFTQPKGTIIEHLAVGSVVIFRYVKTADQKEQWLLVGAFI